MWVWVWVWVLTWGWGWVMIGVRIRAGNAGPSFGVPDATGARRCDDVEHGVAGGSVLGHEVEFVAETFDRVQRVEEDDGLGIDGAIDGALEGTAEHFLVGGRREGLGAGAVVEDRVIDGDEGRFGGRLVEKLRAGTGGGRWEVGVGPGGKKTGGGGGGG